MYVSCSPLPVKFMVVSDGGLIVASINVPRVFRMNGVHFNGGVQCRWGMKKSRFLTKVLLYLGNDIK